MIDDDIKSNKWLFGQIGGGHFALNVTKLKVIYLDFAKKNKRDF